MHLQNCFPRSGSSPVKLVHSGTGVQRAFDLRSLYAACQVGPIKGIKVSFLAILSKWARHILTKSLKIVLNKSAQFPISFSNYFGYYYI